MKYEDNNSELNNINEYIMFLKKQIEDNQNIRKQRQDERKMQAEEAHLRVKLEILIKENERLNFLIENQKDYFEDTEISDIKEHIEENNKEIKIKEKEYIETKAKNEEIKKRREENPIKIEMPEEYSKRIIEIKEKIKQFSFVKECLINGDSFDEAINKLIEYQRERYRMEEKKDRLSIKQDMKRINEDWKIGKEIVDIAYGEHKNVRDNGIEK